MSPVVLTKEKGNNFNVRKMLMVISGTINYAIFTRFKFRSKTFFIEIILRAKKKFFRISHHFETSIINRKILTNSIYTVLMEFPKRSSLRIKEQKRKSNKISQNSILLNRLKQKKFFFQTEEIFVVNFLDDFLIEFN